MRACAAVQDLLGTAEFTLSEVVAARGRALNRTLSCKHGKAATGANGSGSTITLTAEEEANCKLLYHIRFKVGSLGHACVHACMHQRPGGGAGCMGKARHALQRAADTREDGQAGDGPDAGDVRLGHINAGRRAPCRGLHSSMHACMRERDLAWDGSQRPVSHAPPAMPLGAGPKAPCGRACALPVQANGLRNSETFGKSDPFLRISRQQVRGAPLVVLAPGPESGYAHMHGVGMQGRLMADSPVQAGKP